MLHQEIAALKQELKKKSSADGEIAKLKEQMTALLKK